MNTKQYDPKLKPKEHQVIGIQEIRRRQVANFDDPGMGKAKQAYDSIALLIQEKEIDLAIVAMSASLRGNFLREVKEDTDQLIVRVVDGTKTERLKNYRYLGCHVMILSYETLVRDQVELAELFGRYRIFFALDEAHRIKNLSSQMSKAALGLSVHAYKTAVFTGTPIPNRVRDVYPLLKFLGLPVGENLEEFRQQFPTIERLRTFILENSVRRRKDNTKGVKLPKKTFESVPVQLSVEERRIYDDIANRLMAEFSDSFGQTRTIHIQSVLSKLLRLVQFSSNPALLGAAVHGSKLAALEKHCRSILVDKSEKVVIWTSFRDNVKAVCDALKEFEPVILMGGMDRDELMAATARFQSDESCRVLVAIPACAREGFTLTRGRNAVYLDRNFSALDWLQSQDRIHRIGQQKAVRIYVVEAEDTIDKKIEAILRRKESIQAYLVGDQDTLEESPFLDLEQLRGLIA